MPNDEFDANRATDMWCAECVPGADCSQLGTLIESVNAGADYFRPWTRDRSGTWTPGDGSLFLSCLQDGICLVDEVIGWHCAPGYTGCSTSYDTCLFFL